MACSGVFDIVAFAQTFSFRNEVNIMCEFSQDFRNRFLVKGSDVVVVFSSVFALLAHSK